MKIELNADKKKGQKNLDWTLYIDDYVQFQHFGISLKCIIYLQAPHVLQIPDYITDWDLKVNQLVAGNYYPVCFSYMFQEFKFR